MQPGNQCAEYRDSAQFSKGLGLNNNPTAGNTTIRIVVHVLLAKPKSNIASGNELERKKKRRGKAR